MGTKFRFLILYFLSWVLFFELLRLVFVFYHFKKTKQLPVSEILGSFFYGLRMDLSVAAYILAPVCLFVILSLVIRFFRKKLVYYVYTSGVLFLVLLITFFDLEIYNQWGFRMDATPLKFLSTPREALASVSHLPLLLFFIIFFITYGLFFFCFKFLVSKIFFKPQDQHLILTAVLCFLLTGTLIIPIRGGFQLAPINQSSVYFSTHIYANHTAVNASWNFLHSLLSKGSSGKNPYQYFPSQVAKQITDSLYAGGGNSRQLVTFSSAQPTNVIFIIWESFIEKGLHVKIDGNEVFPNFNRLKKQGIYFSNVYASGERTNKGVPAILSGYPAMPATTIIHSPAKSEKLNVLSRLFKEKGYATPFFYGGEPEFANIKSYLLHGGFDPIIGKNDFDTKDMNSKWGAHDGIVMKKVFDELNKSAQPFFATWLTLSSHEPFETPAPEVFKGNDNTSRFLNSLHYTDKVISDFIDLCSRQTWWANTVVIITGDHGHPLPATGSKADEFRIPMLWTGGAVLQPGVVIDKVISQLDIATTLAQQAGFQKGFFPFSKNIFDTTSVPFAFFTFHDGFGFVNSSGRLVFDNIGRQSISREGNAAVQHTNAGKALMQTVYEDFLIK